MLLDKALPIFYYINLLYIVIYKQIEVNDYVMMIIYNIYVESILDLLELNIIKYNVNFVILSFCNIALIYLNQDIHVVSVCLLGVITGITNIYYMAHFL